MKGILADINVIGQVSYLVQQLQSPEWADFWDSLNVSVKHFADIGLHVASTDLEIWQACQAAELCLVTDNRNRDSPDSLEATIRAHNTATSLPVFTISDLAKFKSNADYRTRVIAVLIDYLQRIDSVRGTGRLYLP